MATRYLKWAILAVLVLILLGIAHTFRYVPTDSSSDGPLLVVWDRWLHRPCVFSINAGRLCFSKAPRRKLEPLTN